MATCVPVATTTVFETQVATETILATTVVGDGLGPPVVSTVTSLVPSTELVPISTGFSTCPDVISTTAEVPVTSSTPVVVPPSPTTTTPLPTTSLLTTPVVIPSSSFSITISVPPAVAVTTSNGNVIFSTRSPSVTNPNSPSSPTTSNRNDTAQSSGGGGSSNTGVIVGSTLGALAALGLVVLLARYYITKERRERAEQEREEMKQARVTATGGGKYASRKPSVVAAAKRKPSRRERRRENDHEAGGDFDDDDYKDAGGAGASRRRQRSYKKVDGGHRRFQSEPQFPNIPPSPEGTVITSAGRAGLGSGNGNGAVYSNAAAAVVGGTAPPGPHHSRPQSMPVGNYQQYDPRQTSGPPPMLGDNGRPGPAPFSNLHNTPGEPFNQYRSPSEEYHDGVAGAYGGYAPRQAPYPGAPTGPGSYQDDQAPRLPSSAANGPQSAMDRRFAPDRPQQGQPDAGWFGFLTGPELAAQDPGRYGSPQAVTPFVHHNQQPTSPIDRGAGPSPAFSGRTAPPSYTSGDHGGMMGGERNRSQRSLNRVEEESEPTSAPPSRRPSGRQPLPPNGTRANTRPNGGSGISSVDRWLAMSNR